VAGDEHHQRGGNELHQPDHAELEGEGEITMRAGSAWTQPPKIKHKINDYSEDAELLEIILPADFETVELAG
jgi:hypothetical protein